MPATATKKPKTKQARPAAQTIPAPGEALGAGPRAELAGELRKISIDLLQPSPYQTRKPPAAAWLKELGESLQRDGQLTPCLVRPLPLAEGFELIAGHTRTASARSIGWTLLECRVVECDDATARRLVLIENAKRRDLDVIEQAQALKGLVDDYAAAGRSQRDLAGDVGISQGEISNLTRLLTLPAVWQERLISGEITKSQARELLPWAEVRELWPELERSRKDDRYFYEQFGRNVLIALRQVSRPLKGGFYDTTRKCHSTVAFKATAEEQKHLQVRDVNGEDRAFNTALWDSMQHVAEDKAQERAAKKAEKAAAAGSKLVPDKRTGKLVDSKKVQAEQFNKRLYRWKLRWLQTRIAQALDDKANADVLVLLLVWFATRGSEKCTERRDELVAGCAIKGKQTYGDARSRACLEYLMGCDGPTRTRVIRETLQRWVTHSADGYSTDMPAEFVEQLAAHLGIDIVRHWSLDREFLELLTTAQLQELAAEWKLGWAANQKRSDLIAMLSEHGKEKPCPKAVRGIKAVSLT